MQQNLAGGFSDGSAQFFNLLRTHSIQVTFSDPFYGGNENFIGWDLIGYPGARIAVSANLQRMDVKPESSRKSATITACSTRVRSETFQIRNPRSQIGRSSVRFNSQFRNF